METGREVAISYTISEDVAPEYRAGCMPAGLKPSRLPSYQMTVTLRESGEAHVSGMPFRLDVVETGEQWVVTCTTPHGKAVSRIPAPFSPDALHRALADVEKALIRTYSPVTTRRAAPVDQVVREFGETLSDAV